MSKGAGRRHRLACAHLGLGEYLVLLFFERIDSTSMFCFEMSIHNVSFGARTTSRTSPLSNISGFRVY